MKRIFVLVAILGLVAALGITSVVSAQQGTPPTTPPAPGQGWGQGMMGRGMMGSAQAAGQGLMHPYMQKELAAKLGVTEAELQELHDQGQTFWQIAEAKGFNAEEAQQMMLDARSAALDKMVADGVITQEQADFMKTRMNGNGGRMGGRMGAGGCHGGQGAGQGMMGRGAGRNW